ncbi:MAG: GNAT family N-acetyltransferase [Pseudomonadota bacterium]
MDVDGTQGYVEYEEANGVMTITHTIVPAAIGGRGIAGQLVQAALDHARGAGLKVVPSCSYADDWMRKHPEYQDLRA